MGIFFISATASAIGFGMYFRSPWVGVGVLGALVSIAWFIEEVM